ncbi:MAG: DUF4916 domain-containing protein [Nocardioidaceae bacterium]|nr:DUF4916 domain-containing protein [Nocardioidaceae bacterium]
MTYVRTPDPNPGWLSEHALEEVRGQVPMLYVEAVPVRTDAGGTVTEVGLLLRASATGEMTRTVVAGRVRHGELVRDALMRHLEKDLGPSALPQVPASTVPFAVTEYFPWPGVTTFSDTRQHAVALGYVVPVAGECDPRQDALELTWLSPADAAGVADELEGGRGRMLRQALASVGCLP